MATKDELRQWKKAYKYETDEELKRKREVYRSFIVRKTEEEIKHQASDLESNRALYEELSEIIRRRERTKHRRGRLRELILWAGLLAPFIGGLMTRELWEWINRIFFAGGGVSV